MCGQFFSHKSVQFTGIVYGISTTFGCVKIYIAQKQKLSRNSKRNHVYIMLNVYLAS